MIKKDKKPARVSLVQMKPNRKGKIVEVSSGSNLANRLMSMNVFNGKEITKLSHVGLRGPVVIKVGRSILALGHGVATKIIVESE